MTDRSVTSNLRTADVPREVLLGKTLRQRAHELRIEACGAWSDVVQQPIPGLDPAKCDYAKAIEERLRAIIDELADLSSPVETSPDSRDAARYRWLRQARAVYDNSGRFPQGEALDECCDAFMAKQGETP